jgi:hypothetical protein
MFIQRRFNEMILLLNIFGGDRLFYNRGGYKVCGRFWFSKKIRKKRLVKKSSRLEYNGKTTVISIGVL